MDNNSGFTLFDYCIICNTHLPVKLIDGKSYCTIHYQIKEEEGINKKKAKDAVEWLQDFRKMIVEVDIY